MSRGCCHNQHGTGYSCPALAAPLAQIFVGYDAELFRLTRPRLPYFQSDLPDLRIQHLRIFLLYRTEQWSVIRIDFLPANSGLPAQCGMDSADVPRHRRYLGIRGDCRITDHLRDCTLPDQPAQEVSLRLIIGDHLGRSFLAFDLLTYEKESPVLAFMRHRRSLFFILLCFFHGMENRFYIVHGSLFIRIYHHHIKAISFFI